MDEAFVDVAAVPALSSDEPIAKLTRGIIRYKEGKYEEALADLDWCVEHKAWMHAAQQISW